MKALEFKYNFRISLSALFLVLINPSVSSQELEDYIIQLEQVMSQRTEFDQLKENRINSLIKKKSSISSAYDSYKINDKIYDEYEFYNFDNALGYIEKNLYLATQLEDNLLLDKARLKMGLLLVNTGRYKEAIDILSEIKKDSLPKILLKNYFIAFSEGYSGLAFNTTVSESKSNYTQLYLVYRDSLYSRLDANSEEVLRAKEKDLRDIRSLKMAFIINDKRLSKARKNSRRYSLITFERSLLYELEGDVENQKINLISSAISDIKASVKDNASMATLANILFNEGDIDRAYSLINFSYDDAEFFNSNLRYINIANDLPLISKSYEQKTVKQKKRLQTLLFYITILSFFLVLALYIIYKQVLKVSQARNELKLMNEDLMSLNVKLSEVDRIKENYIGSFLNLYSEYISKLDVYRKQVSKYVKNNQMNALLKLSESKQMIDEELEIFNKNFDNSFLHLHPDFVDSINKLLEDDKRVVVSESNKLNTELRILALIKLGITSSSKIAKILRYSVNTIYNYRAALKNAAKDKSTFEDLVKKIN